jgi:cytochrome P450 family 4
MALLEINAALFYTFLIGLLMVLAYCWRWRRYFQLGMKLPGPPGLPIVGNCHQFISNDLSKTFQKYMETVGSYGPIVRLWFGSVLVVVLTDPDNIETVVKHYKIGNRGYVARKLSKPAFRNGLLCLVGEDWRRHRKIVSSDLHINILEKFVENLVKNSDILANKLKALADGITAHDIAPYLTRCSLDIICQTSSGINMNVQTGNNESTLNNFTFIINTIALRFLKPYLFIDWIFNASELEKKYNKVIPYENGIMTN